MKKIYLRKILIISCLVLCFTNISNAVFFVNKISRNEEKNSIEKNKIKLDKNILKEVLENEEGNCVFSPESLKYVLLLLANGTSGNSNKEILNFLNIKNLSAENEKTRKYFENLEKSEELKISNSVWVNNSEVDLKLKKSYKQITKYLYGKVGKVSYKNYAEKINSFVNERTKNLIPNLLSGNVGEFASILVNTIHFKSDWEKPFKKFKNEIIDFKNSDGTKSKTEFMTKKSDFNYFENEKIQLLEMKYKNSDFSMAVILPKIDDVEKVNSKSYGIDKITVEVINEAFKNKNKCKVEVKVPKFKTNSEMNNLIEILKKSGIVSPFKKKCKDFVNVMFKPSEISNTFCITDIKQKAVIDFYETGTEAAAATYALIERIESCDDYNEFIADHPFVYFIINNKTNEILFIGKQTKF